MMMISANEDSWHHKKLDLRFIEVIMSIMKMRITLVRITKGKNNYDEIVISDADVGDKISTKTIS